MSELSDRETIKRARGHGGKESGEKSERVDREDGEFSDRSREEE